MMKHRIPWVIALTVSAVLVLMTSSGSTAAQGQLRAIADTGVVTLGPNQVLRLTVNGQGGNDTVAVGLRRMSYSRGTCNSGACILSVYEKEQEAEVLAPGEGASFDIPNTAFGVRGVVLSDNQNVRVTAQIIDTATGDVIAIWVPQGSPAVGKQ